MRSVGFYKSLFNLRSRKIQCHHRSYLIKAKSTIFGFVVFDQRFYLTKQFINFFFVRTHLLHPISYFHCIVVKYHISVILRVHRCLYGKDTITVSPILSLLILCLTEIFSEFSSNFRVILLTRFLIPVNSMFSQTPATLT